MDPAREPVLSVVLLARACSGVGDVAGAEGVLRQALAARPNEVVLLNELGGLWEDQARLGEALGCYRAARARRPHLGVRLGTVLVYAGLAANGKPEDAAEGAAVLRDLVARQPNNPEMRVHLGIALAARKEVQGAIASFRKAISLHPRLAIAHSNLGVALDGQKDLDGAIASYQKAIALDPKPATPHYNLGLALERKGDVEGAIACYRKAITADPKFAPAHTNLGNALYGKGKVEQAIECYHKAIAADPKYAHTYNNLAVALHGKGQVEQAIACYRQAIALDPKHAPAHTNLGNALAGKGDVEGAIACFQKAIALDPKHAWARNGLGNVLAGKGDVEGAIACYKKAIALDPKLALARYNLGNTLAGKGEVEEAIACFQKAITLDPEYAEAHCNLGHLLRAQGSFSEALRHLKAGHKLGSRRKGWRYPSAAWVRTAQWLIALDARLAKVLSGQGKPRDAAEGLALAWLCRQPYKRQYALSARLYAAAFAAKDARADLIGRHRYNAACAAALAAAGKGRGAAKLDDEQRAALRRQALSWLEADLTAWTKLLDRGAPQGRPQVQQTLQHWQKDPDLASLRDKDALARLPKAQRQAWGRLWADVADLLKRTHAPE
jgi:tetratricopeptide (TPR) repeat protein